jgi:uncharacterized SAM-binding protein YcdF (DUF218 family)
MTLKPKGDTSMKPYYQSVTEIVFLKDEIKKSDIILIAGGRKAELAYEAYRLIEKGYADLILVSGGKNDNILEFGTECDFLCDILINKGVPEAQIIREDKASNTVENAIFSKQKLVENNKTIRSAILVCKGFHSRRCKITYQIFMDDNIEFYVSSIVDDRNITSDNWFEDEKKKDIVLNELKKIGTYFIELLKSKDR